MSFSPTGAFMAINEGKLNEFMGHFVARLGAVAAATS